MNARKSRWMRHGNCVINLDHVDAVIGGENNVSVYISGSNAPILLKGITVDDVHHYLKYGKPKRR